MVRANAPAKSTVSALPSPSVSSPVATASFVVSSLSGFARSPVVWLLPEVAAPSAAAVALLAAVLFVVAVSVIESAVLPATDVEPSI